MKKLRFLALAVAIAASMSAAGCGQKEEAVSSAPAETKEAAAEVYAEYPDVPDFGKMFGVDLLKTDKDELSTTYTYSRYDGDIDDESEYFQKLIENGYELNSDLMKDYLAVNENDKDFRVPMLHSKGNTVVETERDFDADTFSVIVSDISVYEKIIEDSKSAPKEAVYAEFPEAPDYGAMFNEDLLKTDGNELLMAYTYSKAEEDHESEYIEKLEELGYEIDGDLMIEYLTANEDNEDFVLPILYSNGKTVIQTRKNYTDDTLSILVADISTYEYIIENS